MSKKMAENSEFDSLVNIKPESGVSGTVGGSFFPSEFAQKVMNERNEKIPAKKEVRSFITLYVHGKTPAGPTRRKLKVRK